MTDEATPPFEIKVEVVNALLGLPMGYGDLELEIVGKCPAGQVKRCISVRIGKRDMEDILKTQEAVSCAVKALQEAMESENRTT